MHAVTDTMHEGFATVTLSSGDAEASFAPGLGMIGCSLRHRGVELLGLRGGLKKYAEHGSTMGIPLLHPWANRLGGFSYRAAGRDVTLDAGSPLLHRDANGLPMHGLLAAYPGWRVVDRGADQRGARLSALLDFAADARLLAAFPFPHTLRIDVELRDRALTIATTLRATGDVAVPVSFGFHPYVQLPGVARADWQIAAPVRRRLQLDQRMIPTGASEPSAVDAAPLGERTYDDLYADLARPATFVLSGGGRRIAVGFDDGYRFAQIYAPAGEPLICFEPMTAPSNALISGDGLTTVAPGTEYTASFTIDSPGSAGGPPAQ